MKRIYTILSCLLLAGMLCIGLYALLDKDATYSESERRKLKTRPKLTFSAMLDGSYASDYRDYFADTFPNREKLMNANRSLNGFYYFSGGSKDGAQLVINMNGGAANHGEALPCDAVDELIYLLLGTYVDAAGGVVQYQQLGVGSQPFGQQHLLLVAAGQLNNGVFRGSADHV